MTVHHTVSVFEASGFVSMAQKAVLLEIAYRLDRKGVLRTSQSEIAQELCCARSTVAKWFAEFEASGILQREGHGRYKWSCAEDVSDGLKPVSRIKPRDGAMDELKRLQGIVKPNEGIVWTKDRWPVIQVFGD